MTKPPSETPATPLSPNARLIKQATAYAESSPDRAYSTLHGRALVKRLLATLDARDARIAADRRERNEEHTYYENLLAETDKEMAELRARNEALTQERDLADEAARAEHDRAESAERRLSEHIAAMQVIGRDVEQQERLLGSVSVSIVTGSRRS
jgi:septal ring factor EnvC (AmiA/AmiB activator)